MALGAVSGMDGNVVEAEPAQVTGLTNGMTAEAIRQHYGLSAVEYDTARRRMRRAMLRHGLAWSWP